MVEIPSAYPKFSHPFLNNIITFSNTSNLKAIELCTITLKSIYLHYLYTVGLSLYMGIFLGPTQHLLFLLGLQRWTLEEINFCIMDIDIDNIILKHLLTQCTCTIWKYFYNCRLWFHMQDYANNILQEAYPTWFVQKTKSSCLPSPIH